LFQGHRIAFSVHLATVHLAAQGYVPADTAIKGYGKLRPAAPNTFPDGRDNPEGRQKNRRVDIAINTCG
jgi:outer membrane protein OmpA-like peptidoglycan-associated protein